MTKAFFDTKVNAQRSQAAIDDLLRKHGVDAIRWTTFADEAVLEFKTEWGSFALRVREELADARTPQARRNQVFRALHWYVKAKLDAVDFGLEDMRCAFMPYLITAPNRTLIDDVNEAMEKRQLGIDIPLLPEGRR